MSTSSIVAILIACLPIVGAILNVVFRARTEEEYAKLPRWFALVVFSWRKVFPDMVPVMLAIAAELRRIYLPTMPGVESLPPPEGASVAPLVLPKSAPVIITTKEDGDGPR